MDCLKDYMDKSDLPPFFRKGRIFGLCVNYPNFLTSFQVVGLVKSEATPMQIEVTWYSSRGEEVDDNSSSFLKFEQVRSFKQFYQVS